MYRSCTAPQIKLRDCFMSIMAKNKIQETTLGDSCYDNYKTRLSVTKYLAFRNKYIPEKEVCMTSFEAQWGGCNPPTPPWLRH